MSSLTSQNIKCLVQAILGSDDSLLSANKQLVDELVGYLVDITGIDLHPEYFLDRHASQTANGKAVSCITAAQCAEEYMRTQVFLRAVFAAISSLSDGGKPVQVLYAGTGPFGLLVVPLLHLFSAEQVQVTLLDIHQESLDMLQRVTCCLGVNGCIKKIECIDILQWQPADNQKYDLVVSETMKAMLEQEPQVSIFAHLARYLTDHGQLIPQSIEIHAWLTRQEKELSALHLGCLFRLDKHSALSIGVGNLNSLSGEIIIPEYDNALTDLKFCTEIQVHEGHKLTERQCSLNLPKIEADARPVPNSKLKFLYQLGPYPRFTFDYQSQGVVDRALLTGSENTDSLGVFHLERLWQRVQLNKSGYVEDEFMEFEYPLDLALFDGLKIAPQAGYQQLYQSTNKQEFISYILAQHEGSLSRVILCDTNRALKKIQLKLSCSSQDT